jgi:hypothetical protein
MRPKSPEPLPDQMIMAYDHVDRDGNVISKVFINQQDQKAMPQVATLPAQAGVEEPNIQTLQAVPITITFPPMFVLKSSIDHFQACNQEVACLTILTQNPEREVDPLNLN